MAAKFKGRAKKSQHYLYLNGPNTVAFHTKRAMVIQRTITVITSMTRSTTQVSFFIETVESARESSATAVDVLSSHSLL